MTADELLKAGKRLYKERLEFEQKQGRKRFIKEAGIGDNVKSNRPQPLLEKTTTKICKRIRNPLAEEGKKNFTMKKKQN